MIKQWDKSKTNACPHWERRRQATSPGKEEKKKKKKAEARPVKGRGSAHRLSSTPRPLPRHTPPAHTNSNREEKHTTTQKTERRTRQALKKRRKKAKLKRKKKTAEAGHTKGKRKCPQTVSVVSHCSSTPQFTAAKHRSTVRQHQPPETTPPSMQRQRPAKLWFAEDEENVAALKTPPNPLTSFFLPPRLKT